MERLIIGCGYLGSRVAARWLAAGDRVSALTRSAENAARLQECGITPYLGDVLQPDSLAQLPAVDTVLWAVGWDRASGKSQHEVYVQGLQNALRHLSGRYSRWVGISSTSVYGQTNGEWVDETSPCEPTQPNGQVCLEAEELVRDTTFMVDATRRVTLRLSGIYGPGRLLSRVAGLRAGEPISGKPDSWLNLIHVDDAAEAVLCVATAVDPSPQYLISDSEPLTRHDYYSLLASLVEAPPPRFADDGSIGGSLSAGTRTAGLNKRCSNALARQELAWNLKYPTYREGLPHAVGAVE